MLACFIRVLDDKAQNAEVARFRPGDFSLADQIASALLKRTYDRRFRCPGLDHKRDLIQRSSFNVAAHPLCLPAYRVDRGCFSSEKEPQGITLFPAIPALQLQRYLSGFIDDAALMDNKFLTLQLLTRRRFSVITPVVAT